MTTTTYWGVVVGASLLLPHLSRATHQEGQTVPAAKTEPAPVFEALWRQPIEATGAPQLAAGGALILLADAETGVAGYSIDDGHHVWAAPLPSLRAPVVGGNSVFVASGGGIHALDLATGRPRWVANKVGEPRALTWHSNQLVAAAGTEIYAWLEDGTGGWRRDLGAAVVTPTAIDGELIFAGLADRRLVALDATTGVPRWAVALSAEPRSLVATRGRLYCSGADDAIYAYLQRPEQDPAWQLAAAPVVGELAVDDRRIYVAFLDTTLRALDLRTGNLRWRTQLPSRPASGPFIVEDKVAVPLTSGDLFVMRLADGKPVPRPAASTPATPAVTPPTPVVLKAIVASSDKLRVFVVLWGEDGSRTLSAFRYGGDKAEGKERQKAEGTRQKSGAS